MKFNIIFLFLLYIASLDGMQNAHTSTEAVNSSDDDTQQRTQLAQQERQAYEQQQKRSRKRKKWARNKYYIQCTQCGRWHEVPNKKTINSLSSYERKTFTCFRNTWGTLDLEDMEYVDVSKDCANSSFLIVFVDEPCKAEDNIIQCSQCQKFHVVPVSTGYTQEELDNMQDWTCTQKSWGEKATCPTNAQQKTRSKGPKV